MPSPPRIQKAKLQPIRWDNNHRAQPADADSTAFSVQFNPETLKLTYANQTSTQDPSGGASRQYVGKGTTRLSIDLWFDLTTPDAPSGVDDVRDLTLKVLKLIEPREQASGEEGRFVPPGVRFLWGSFLFEGVVDSINETLEMFSEQGKPLRASVSMSLSEQTIFLKKPKAPRSDTTNTFPPSRQGESLQAVAARSGRQDRWQEIAERNDIDDPLRLPFGSRLTT